MRRIVFTSLLLVCVLRLWASTGKSLFITFTDNTKVEFALSDTPEVTIAGDSLVVTTPSLRASYLLQQVSTFTYSTATGIRVVSPDDISVGTDYVSVAGIHRDVRLFALNGTAVTVRPRFVGGHTVVILSDLPHGIYIVSIHGQSLKVTRK